MMRIEQTAWLPCHPQHGPVWDAITFQAVKPSWTYRGQEQQGYIWLRCTVRIDTEEQRRSG